MRISEFLFRKGREFHLLNSSVSIVLPLNEFIDQFLMVRGKSERGGNGPEHSLKNLGGGWNEQTIAGFLERNNFEGLFYDMHWERNSLLALGGAAEVWEESCGEMVITLPEIHLLKKVKEDHIPDRETSPRGHGVHVRAMFSIERVFQTPTSFDPEIYDGHAVTLHDVTRGAKQIPGEKRETTISIPHKEAILLAHKVLRFGDMGGAASFKCSVEGCPLESEHPALVLQ